MRRRSAVAVQAGLCLALLIAASATLVPSGGSATDVVAAGSAIPAAGGSFVTASSPEEAGKYLIKIGGCNDCHTPGFMEKGDAVPESEWLIGVPVGFNGPWGTTYGSNLRIFAQDFDEETFCQVVRARTSRPPMVWPSIHAMSDRDLRAIYRYIRSLPVKGEKMPEALPPGIEPTTPYIVMVPTFPPGTEPPAAPSTQPVVERAIGAQP